MIIWIMMALDLLSFGALTFSQFGIYSATYLLVAGGLYLIAKLAIFKDVMSGIDAIFGVYMIVVAIFHFTSFFYYFMLGWMLYKLFFTWIK